MEQVCPHRAQRGVSMVETLVVVAILVPALTVILSGSGTVVKTSLGAVEEVGAERQMIFTTRRIREELEQAQVDTVAPDGLSVTYRKALDITGTGLPVDATGAVNWGAMESSGPVVGSTYTLSFVQEDILREDALGKDLNGDGDQADVFRRGHLERRTSQGTVFALSPAIVLLDAFSDSADLDGDGEQDPLFALGAGEPLTVRLFTRVGRSDARVGTHLTKLRIHMPNRLSGAQGGNGNG